MIQVHNISLSYQKGSQALSNISFRVEKGDFCFLTGPSGAGKSTLLKLMYGALVPDRGQIIVDGLNITRMPRSQLPQLRRGIGVVFQDFKLLGNRTVFDNVALTLEVLGWSSRDIGKKVFHILKQVGLEKKLNETPFKLSGGEQQRVALARALVNDPKILLADEPTGNLDDANKRQVMEIFREANLRGTTVLVASHDRRAISAYGRSTVCLNAGEMVEEAGVA